MTISACSSSKLEVGSSAKINLGELTKARAMDTRCASPSLRVATEAFALSSIPNSCKREGMGLPLVFTKYRAISRFSFTESAASFDEFLATFRDGMKEHYNILL